MGNLFKHSNFSFNSTGQMEGGSIKPFQLFLDEKGTISNRTNIEYGIYNKIVNIEYKKVFMIQKHFIGIGDIVDWITKITKIKDLIVYITKGNCGCEQRRIKLNKWFKIYWLSIKFRQIYADDYRIIPQQKKLLKEIINKPLKEVKEIDPKYMVKSSQKPINEIQQKKSCGCGSRRNIK